MLKRVLIVLMGVAFLLGCPSPASVGSSDSSGGSTAARVTTDTIIGELESALSVRLEQTDVDIIGGSARSAVGGVTSDVSSHMDDIVEGAMTGLNGLSINYENRMQLVDTIVTSVMTSVNTHKSNILVPSRSTDPYADAMAAILQQIAAASIRNLSNAGISDAELADAAQDTVGILVGSLDEGGVQPTEVPSVMQVITQSALEGVVENSTDGALLLTAVESITQGAVEAVNDIEVEGMDSAVLPAIVGGIASGAADAIEVIADDMGAADTLTAVSDLTTAITGSVVESSGTLGMDGESFTQLVENVTQGVVESVGNMTFADLDTTGNNTDTVQILGGITEAASAAAVDVANGDAGIDAADMLIAVTEGASDGAQSMTGFDTAAALSDAILLDQDGEAGAGTAETVTTIADSDLTTAVSTGVAQATNTPPVAIAGEDQNVHPGDTVDFDGSASYDDDGDALTYEWFLSSLPEGVTLTLADSSVASFSQTLDTSGEYVLGLKVSDAYSYDINFITVNVAPDLYNGLTAQESYDLAVGLASQGDNGGAITGFNNILDNFTSLAPSFEGMVYVQLARSLRSNEQLSESITNYMIVRANFSGTQAYYSATQDLGWIYQIEDSVNNMTTAASLLNEVISDNPGTEDYAWALDGLGWNYMQEGDYTASLTNYELALTVPQASNNCLYWTLFHIAENDELQGNYAASIPKFREVLTNTDYARALKKADGSKDYWLVKNTLHHIAWIYESNLNDSSQAISAWQEIADYTGMPDSERMRALYEIGLNYNDQGRNNGDDSAAVALFSQAEAKFAQAYGLKNSDPEMAAWVANNRGENYINWLERTDSSQEAALLANLVTVSNHAINSGYSSQAARAYIKRGETYLWRLSYRDYTRAQSDLEAAVSLADSNGLDEEAWARFTLGILLMDLGWDHYDEVGYPWRTRFNEAIDQFEQITAANFPGLAGTWMERFFPESQSRLVQCRLALGEYDDVISDLTDILNGDLTPYSDEEVAEFRRMRGEAYETKGDDLNDSNPAGSQAAYESAVSDYDDALAAASSLSFDGDDWKKTVFLNSCNLEAGRSLYEIGQHYRNDDDNASAVTRFENALTYLDAVVDQGEWRYGEAQRRKARCYQELAECHQELGNDADALDALNALLAMVSVLDGEEVPEIYNRAGDVYQNAYEDSGDSDDYDAAKGYYNDAIAHPDANEWALCDAYEGLGWLEMENANRTAADFAAYETLSNAAYDSFGQILTVVFSSGEDYDREASRALRHQGYVKYDLAWAYNNFNQPDPDQALFRGYLIDALDCFEDAMDDTAYPGMEREDFFRAKLEVFSTAMRVCESFDIAVATPAEYEPYCRLVVDNFYDLTANESELDAEDLPSLYLNMGQFELNAHGLAAFTVNAGSYEPTAVNAVIWFTTVNNNWPGGNDGGAGIEALYFRAQAHGIIGLDFELSGDYDSAIAEYLAGETDYNSAEAAYPGSDWDWIIDSLPYDRQDLYIFLAEAYKARYDAAASAGSGEENGDDITDAIAYCDLAIALHLDREVEADTLRTDLVNNY